MVLGVHARTCHTCGDFNQGWLRDSVTVHVYTSGCHYDCVHACMCG